MVNTDGDPIEGAVVTLSDTSCDDKTDALGAYRVACRPDHHTVIVSAEDYFPGHHTVDGRERVPHLQDPIALIATPPSDGLWFAHGAGWQTPTPGFLSRTADSQTKLYCLVVDESPANLLSAGPVRILDQQASPWRLFRLDDAGCAQHFAWRAGAWRVEQSNEPETPATPLGSGQLHTVALEPGEYFVADWSSDRFEIDAEQTAVAAAKRYAGARLVVQ